MTDAERAQQARKETSALIRLLVACRDLLLLHVAFNVLPVGWALVTWATAVQLDISNDEARRRMRSVMRRVERLQAFEAAGPDEALRRMWKAKLEGKEWP